MRRELKAADVTFISGEGLESWFERLVKASGYSGKPVIASEGIKTRTMDEDGKTITDPHVWNSPVNIEVWVGNIEKALTAADPEDAAIFKANADRYTNVLKELDAYAKAKFETVPQRPAQNSDEPRCIRLLRQENMALRFYRLSVFRPRQRLRPPTLES